MPRTEGLNKIEQLILLALARLGDDAYGMSVRDEIESRTGRSLSIAAVYNALDRLERSGLIGANLSSPTTERGGRAKKHFQIKAAAVRALRDEQTVMEQMWKDLDLPVER
jgi:PadR family transcriptional regulator PadR